MLSLLEEHRHRGRRSLPHGIEKKPPSSLALVITPAAAPCAVESLSCVVEFNVRCRRVGLDEGEGRVVEWEAVPSPGPVAVMPDQFDLLLDPRRNRGRS